MNISNMVLKTRLSEKLKILNFIILIYAIFLVIVGLKTHNSELIIETCIMFAVCVIFECFNTDLTYVSERGISSKKLKEILWKDINKIQRKSSILYIYTNKKEVPYKISVSKYEDVQEISRVYKYMLSKI